MKPANSIIPLYILTYFDGFLFALMVSTTESYALYYMTKQGITGVELGILTTVPILAASLTQLIIPRLIPTKFIGIALLFFLASQLVGLWGILYYFLNPISFMAILFSLSLYWIGGQNSAPLWVDLVNQKLTQDGFSNYFSTRNMFVAFSTMVFFIAFSQFERYEIPFYYLFYIGFAARLISFAINGIFLKKYPITFAKQDLKKKWKVIRIIINSL